MTTNIKDVVAEEINEEDITEFERKLAQAILGALEYRGFYDCGKYLDTSLIEHIRPLLTQLVKEVKAGEREKVVKHFEKYLLDWKDGMTENSPTAKISWVVEEIKALTPPTTDEDKVHGVIIGKE